MVSSLAAHAPTERRLVFRVAPSYYCSNASFLRLEAAGRDYRRSFSSSPAPLLHPRIFSPFPPITPLKSTCSQGAPAGASGRDPALGTPGPGPAGCWGPPAPVRAARRGRAG